MRKYYKYYYQQLFVQEEKKYALKIAIKYIKPCLPISSQYADSVYANDSLFWTEKEFTTGRSVCVLFRIIREFWGGVYRSVVVKSSNQVNKPWVYSLEGSVVQLFHVFDNILSFEYLYNNPSTKYTVLLQQSSRTQRKQRQLALN